MNSASELIILTAIVLLTIALVLWFALFFVPSMIEDIRKQRP
jgi:hypothetical protein